MTDPIVQDQTQNGQNPQTTQITTPEIDFDLNLPTNEETPSAEEPAVSFDFSNLETKETVSIDEQQPKTEKSSVTIEENQPKAEDLQQNIINSIDNISLNETTETELETVQVQPETTKFQSEAFDVQEISESQIESQSEAPSNPIDEIATELPIANKEEPIQQPKTKDDRIEKEDALVAEEKQAIEEKPIIETKEIPEIQPETLNIFEETQTSDEEAPTSEEEIIQQDNSNNNEMPLSQESSAPTTETTPIETEQSKVEEIPEEKPAPVQPEQNSGPSTNFQQDQIIIQQLQASAGIQSIPVATTQQVAPAPTEINLDDLLNSPTPQQTGYTQPVNVPTSNIISPSNLSNPSTIPAFTGIQGYSISPIATQISEQIKKPLNKKILINVGIGVFALFIGWFMFKTMYPLEYQKIVGNGSQPTTIETQLTNNTTLPTEEIPSNDSDLFNNPALDNYHGSAPDFTGVSDEEFNAFEDIEKELPTDNKIIEKIQNYIDVGRKYTVIGKKNNDKDIMKSSLFLYKKASTLLTDIENGTQISTDELNKQLSELESYLQKLTGKNSDGEIVLQQPAQPTPEEFFGIQNLSTTETTNKDETNTQENEIENLSGNENSIIQPNESYR